MTKNTTKKRKRKNMKMRRTVRKTIAAIFMIMAVVVAAIPVEQLGTMQAKTTKRNTVNMDQLYDEYDNDMSDTSSGRSKDDANILKEASGNVSDFISYSKKTTHDTGNSTTDAKYQTVKVTANDDGTYSLNREFLVDPRNQGSGHVIVGYSSDSAGSANISITDEMCTKYFVITDEYVEAVKTDSNLTKETYTVKFQQNPVTSGLTYTLTYRDGTAQETLTATLKNPQLYDLKNPTFSGNFNSSTITTKSGKKYKYSTWPNEYTNPAQYFITNYANDYADYVSTLQEYNDTFNKFIDNLKNSYTATVADAAAGDAVKQQVKDDIDKLDALADKLDSSKTWTHTQMLTYDGFLEKCIEKRFCKEENGFSLYGFTLYKVNDNAGTNGVYIPKWNGSNPKEEITKADGSNAVRATSVDSNGFIMEGKISVNGIGNNAFEGVKTFTSITLSDNVQFIGNEAFKDCTNLRNVELAHVQAVGNRAFEGCSSLEQVTFMDSTSVSATSSVLGAETFYGCTSLQSVTFPNTLKSIGRGCFAKTTKLQSFYINDNNAYDITIWPFAFYDCVNLNDTGDGTTSDSFFPDKDFSKTIRIGLGAFAVAPGNSGVMSTFTFPNNMSQIIYEDDAFELKDTLKNYSGTSNNVEKEVYYDYLLANRTGLNKVVFPYKLGISSTQKIPDNTLMGCSNLECAVFGELSFAGGSNVRTTYDVPAPENSKDKKSYDTDEDDETLFQDIENSNFYVEGPGFMSSSNTSNPASPRKITWAAQTAANDYVPYMFLNSTDPGDKRIEMSAGDNNEYLAVLQVTDDTNKYAKLVKYTYRLAGNQPEIADLKIPAYIGAYKITELGEGCFSEIKDKVKELIIEDGSVSSIEARAFTDSKTLQKVTIGNSVQSIGDEAFRGCSKLENVIFSSPKPVNSVNDESSASEWEAVLSIGANAFKTGSEYLTFHGDVHSGYAPFELAMSDSGFSSKSNMNICYKTDAPSHLTIIRDNETGMSTLIDYPHYEEVDTWNPDLIQKIIQDGKDNGLNTAYSITSKFEELNGWTDTSKYGQLTISNDENDIIAGTYKITVPDGVQSVNASRYFQYSSNQNNKNYLYITYSEDADGNINRSTVTRKLNGGSADIVDLYSNDNANSDITKAGLFSGYFLENSTGIISGLSGASQNKEFKGIKTHTEDDAVGNDQLLMVDMNSIEYLPDYAFDSCENLVSAALGNGMKDVGIAPFRRCASLTGIEGNGIFTYDNGILYKAPVSTNSDEATSGVTISECLMTRGNLIGQKSINSASDPNLTSVTAIAKEAFAYCPYIQSVNLRDTQVEIIPDECFRGSSKLSEIILPSTVSRIDSKAFSETSHPTVYITNPTCQIASDAFDKGVGKIVGYRYSDSTNTKPSTAYQYAQYNDIEFEELTSEYFLTFLDYDGSLIETQTVEEGKDGVEPTWTPSRKGYEFKEWSWEKSTGNIVTGDNTYRNVTENRIIVATYSAGSNIISDGNEYTLTITKGTNIDGKTSVPLKGGTAVTVKADDAASGTTFQYWSESTGTYLELFENIHSSITTFIMPNANVTIIANYATTGSNSGNSGNNNSGNNGNNSSSDTTTKYKLTVNYGSGSGEYAAGQVVTISAFAPESSSKVFSKWTTTTTGVGFASATSASTTITMPASEVTVTANYKTRTSDDEDDSDAAARRRGTSTTTTTTTVANGTNNAQNTTTTSTTGTTTTTTPATAQGDRLSIDKSGISNKDVGSTTVEGATDNFVVKISDSDSAVSEAQAALLNKFGSLDGIVYFPMDISLYDATGKNKITDTTGLNVTVTVPIPDEMIQYGGNVHMAAIENSQLQDLNVKFTTIDGIACMSFVAPHFSPYVAYVDTQNLVAGQMLDATPKTGDPIHPKWFLAASMACLSIILFASGDKKRRIKIA